MLYTYNNNMDFIIMNIMIWKLCDFIGISKVIDEKYEIVSLWIKVRIL